MLTTGLNFVMIHVSDVESAKTFFIEKFDLAVEAELPDFVQFKAVDGKGAELAIGKDNTTPDPGTELWWYVEDVDQAFETLQKRGTTIKTPIVNMPFGRTFSVEGPGGYVLYLLQLA